MNSNKSSILISNIHISICLFLSIFILAYPFGPLVVNSSIFLISCLGCYLFFKKNEYKILKDKLLLVLLILILYLIFNSLINLTSNSLFKSFSYLRFYFFAISLYLIFKNYSNIQRYFFFIIVGIGTFLSLDIIFQFINYRDIFGFLPGICQFQNSEMVNCQRFSGFFDQELIAGSYLAIFGIPSIFFSINLIKKNQYIKFIYLTFFLSLFTLSILISGERNAILILLIFLFFLFVLNKSLRKWLVAIFIIYFVLIYFSLQNFKHLKHRYIEYPSEFSSFIKDADLNLIGLIASNQYGMHFINSYHIFSQNKIFGTGVRSFRNECQKNSKVYLSNVYQFKDITLLNNGCSSHPHNLYFELASETGLVGLTIFVIFLYFLIIKNLKDNIDNNYLSIAISILISLIFPLKPTGAIFSTVYASFIFYYVGLLLFYKDMNKKI